MIRAKHISNLSSTARSFFLNGSRTSVTDGNSCVYSDDENCVSKRQQLRKEAGQTEKRPSSILPKPSVVGCILPGEVTKPVVPKKVDDFGRPSLLPQHVSSSPALPLKSHSVNYASTVVREEVEGKASSEPIGDQIFKAGIVAVNFLSDLSNCKIPSYDGGSDAFGLPKSCMVDPTRPISSVKSSNVKAIRREHFAKIYPRSAAKESSVGTTRNPSSNFRGAKEAERTGFVKGFRQVSNSVVGKSLPTTNNTYGKRTSVLQRPHIDSNRFVPSGFSNSSVEMMKGPSGTALTSRQYCNSGHIVENVSSVLRRFRWGPAAEEALQNLGLRIDAYQANQVLKQMNDYGNALGFFYWLKRQPGFKHDGHTYTTMVGNLGRAKQFGAINKLLDEMVRDGCQPNTVTYNRLIHSYGRANYLNEAMNVFNQMQEAGCKPDRVTYCTLIDIHAKAGFLDIAMDMYQRMQAGGLSPDTFTYSVIINCLGKAGHLPAAHKLFCEMVDQGCTPNLVTYNIMMDLHAKARNYQNALKLYRDMQNAGFEPDKVTYSIVMEVLGHCGYLEEAEAVFTEMQQKNWIPDEPVYGLLVDLWGKAGNVEKAWQWYQAMLHAGLRPNVPTCNSLLSTFLRVNKIAEAYELLQNMLALGLRPSLQTYTLLLSCCTDGRSKLDMGFCGQLMASTGHPAHMFLLKMPAAGPDGENVRNHANNFLDLMHSEDRESKRGLVDAVVDFLHKSGQKEEAGSVWEVAAQKNVFPDALREKSCSYWLINLHVMSEGTAVTALSRTLAWFRKQMLASGTCPSRIDIVTGWGRRSRVTGTSMVRQAVEELLNIFGSPFFTESGNSGCFVGSGEPLNRWLLQSHVERMHLLDHLPPLPIPSSLIDELPSAAAGNLTSQRLTYINLTPIEPLPMETSSIEINELPLATKTQTPPASVEPIPMETSSIDELPSSDSNATDNIEAVGEKRKRADEDEKTNLESSDTKITTPSPWWKTSLCSYFRREASCSHGNECKYAHGEAELRMKPDNTWDPTSERGKKAKAMKMSEHEEKEEDEVLFTEQMMESIDGDEGGGGSVSVVDLSLSKCLVHLPNKWQSDELKKFLGEQGVLYKSAKKRRGMIVGFVTFENAEQLQSGVEILDGKTVNSSNLKIADVLPRTFDKNDARKSVKSARDAVTPLAYLSYADQLEQKKTSIGQMLKKLARNARKACPNGNSLPQWVLTSRDRGGLACNLEGIIESPITNGYRNKCEFSVGLSLQGKPTVGFSLGSFCAGVTAVEEPVDCPNVSKIASQYASIFQKFIENSKFQVWNRFQHSGFWRQLTVREGRKPGVFSNDEDAITRIAEVMLMVQVCLTGSDEAEVATEFEELAKAFAEGARASSPTLPLTVLVVQNHSGISNVAPPDAPLQVLAIPISDNGTDQEQTTNVLTEARIHDHINNLRFSISPTAFFQVNTVTAEKLYSIAGDWADLGPDTLLFDVCCGTGTIGLTLAHRVGMVIGIEMNASAVADAERNATINGISNCKFICSKAEDVMSSLLKQYLDVTQMEEAKPLSNANDDLNKQIPSTEEMTNSEHVADQNLPPSNTQVEELQDNEQKDSSSLEPEKTTKPQFKNVVAIVDPPRSGLHPAVIKALRTHPRLKRLVYISCNPETLVANAIELCTPSFDEPDRGNKNYRGRKKIGIAALARHRAKSMPTSEAFRPVKAMAVDLFPHTDHCEMVMLLER